MTSYKAVLFGVVDSGVIAKLCPAEVRVYVVLFGHALKRPEVWPSLYRIGKLAGVTERAARRAIRALEDDHRLIVVHRGGGRLRCNVYQLNTDHAVPLSSANGDHRVPLCASKRGTARVQKGDPTGPKGGPHDPPEEGEGIGTEQKQQPGGAASAASEDLDPTVLRELDLAGIAEPTRSKLAGEPGITPSMVRKAKVPGRRPGAIIENIRSALRCLRARSHERSRHETTIDPTLVRLRAEDDQIERPDSQWIREEAAHYKLPASAAQAQS